MTEIFLTDKNTVHMPRRRQAPLPVRYAPFLLPENYSFSVVNTASYINVCISVATRQ